MPLLVSIPMYRHTSHIYEQLRKRTCIWHENSRSYIPNAKRLLQAALGMSCILRKSDMYQAVMGYVTSHVYPYQTIATGNDNTNGIFCTDIIKHW